jgi:hypothetical protein
MIHRYGFSVLQGSSDHCRLQDKHCRLKWAVDLTNIKMFEQSAIAF